MLKRTTSEIILLMISAFAVIAISPFIYLRFIVDDYVMAALDAVIVILMSLFFLFTYKTRKADLAKLIFAILII
jgi:ABC-type sulfate transport system permease component